MLKLTVLVLFLIGHATFGMGTLFLANLFTTEADYGGSMGFLPSTGDADSPYDSFSNFLAGDEGVRMEEVSDGGGTNFISWAISTPVCGISKAVRVMLATASFNYGVANVIPTEGPGLWVRLIISLIGTLLTLFLLNEVVGFAVRAGVFSNIWSTGAILGIAAIGGAATGLDGLGPLSC